MTEDRADLVDVASSTRPGDFMTPRVMVVTATIALAAVIVGPFGTYWTMGAGLRAVYWPVIVFFSTFCAIMIRCSSNRYLQSLNRPATYGLEGIAMATILTAAIVAWTRLLLGSGYEFATPLWAIWFTTAVIFGLVHIIADMFRAAEARQPAPSVEAHVITAAVPDKASIPRLRARLPLGGTAPIVHIASDDHYVDIGCADGTSHRLLLRLAEAMKEMDGVPGFQVHRSHWVARDYISSVRREAGKTFVLLTSGQTIPVSRTYRPNLVEAGFLTLPGTDNPANGTGTARGPVRTATASVETISENVESVQ